MSDRKQIRCREIQDWLIIQLSERLDMSQKEINIREPFGNLGLSSSEAVILTGDLEEWMGKPVSSTSVWDYPTIEELSNFLAHEKPLSVSTQSNVCLNDGNDKSIAIIGMACRFPQATTPEEFWDLLRNGVDAITEIPPSRWDANEYYSPEPATPGKMNSKWGGFIENPEWFDASFFGLSPREAESMDPQQRLLLEVAWEALENAGIPISKTANSPTGVFIGISTNDYSRPQSPYSDCLNAYYGTGTASSVAANRLSYFFDWRGPSVALDTACSSSLVAVHLACQSLLAGDCELAVAGGVNLILSPDLNIVFSQARMLSPDGRCRTFDASANGYVRGEGCGVVVLRPLSRAFADGDPILAVIRSSAVNQDGRSNGLTAPNGPAQEAVIRKALEKAGLPPDRIDYVETHGTGTPLGDPIEVESLKKVLMKGREPDRICYIGSVKTNIGHLEAAAGIAGLIKTVLMLQHREIPPHLHFAQLNPHISLNGFPCAIATDLRRFVRKDEPLRCGVSSFGFGGANVHAIVEESPIRPEIPVQMESEISSLIPLSAAHSQALQDSISSFHSFLFNHRNLSFSDIVYTTTIRRSHLERRFCTIAKNRDELIRRLDEYRNGVPDQCWIGRTPKTGKPRLVFVFSGQGNQWACMGRDLLENEPAFVRTMHRLETLFAARVNWSLLNVLKSDKLDDCFSRTDLVQPVIFALQIALVELLQSWGVKPDAVVGHSMGEIAAACTAGALTLEDAVSLIVHRGAVMQTCAGKGCMAAVSCSSRHAAQTINLHNLSVSIAAINSPSSTVLSGSPQAVQKAIERFEIEGVHCKPLQGTYAFHSPQMDALQKKFIDRIQSIPFSVPRIPLVSTVTGKLIQPGNLSLEYWAKNIREPVLFQAAIETLLEEDFNLFLEIGPHPALCGNIAQIMSAQNREGTVLPSLRRGRRGRDTLLEAAGQLYTLGLDIEWERIHPAPASFIRLPNYPWQRERFWRDDHFGLSRNGVARKAQINHSIRNNWLYQLHWAPCLTLENGSKELPQKSYIVFCDSLGFGSHFSQILQHEKLTVVQIKRGSSFVPVSENCFQIHVANLHDFRELFHSLFSRGGDSEYEIIYLWGLDARIDDNEVSTDFFPEAQRLTCLGPVHLMQALNLVGGRPIPRVWLVTQGSQNVDDYSGELQIAQSLEWGIGRAIAHEFPAYFGGMIDLDNRDTPIDFTKNLLSEIMDNAGDLFISYREKRRYAARLREYHPPERPKPLRMNDRASYLITGGLGTLGLQIARRLIERGAHELILMARTPLPARETWDRTDAPLNQALKIRQIKELEAMGAIVRIVCGDVSNEKDINSLLEREKNENWALIRGVIHAAGDLRAKPMRQIDEAFIDSVLRAKVTGTWLLHRYFKNRELDFFILFSSASTIVVPSGHAAYAAANSFLDSMAYLRGREKQRATSIGWGVWEDAGTSARSIVDSFVHNQMEVIDFQSGFDWMERLAGEETPHAYVIPGGWRDWLQYCPELEKDGILQDIANLTIDRVVSSEPGKAKKKPIQDILLQTEQENRRSILRQFVLSELARIVKTEELRIDPNQSLFHLGFDSLMAVEMKNRIETNIGIVMPVAKLLEGKSINEYTDLLFSMLEKQKSVQENENSESLCNERETIQI